MKKQNWFQSPLPTPFNFAQQLNKKEQEPEEQQQLRLIDTPGLFARNHLSPFTHYQEQRLYSPEKLREEPENSVSQEMERVIFSDGSEAERDEQQYDEKVQTPQKQIKIKEELHSTGTKSVNDKLIEVKKSRPKEKGLRGLSARAYNVVLQMKSTTYKEVAVKLLKELDFRNQLDTATQQTNVKRRVYDALNVLIAVGILEKDGRKIITRHGGKGPMANHNEIELASLSRRLAVKEENVKEKRKKLEETRQKMRGIQSLIDKNRKNKHRVERSGQFISFPFVGISDFTNCKVEQQTPTTLKIRFDVMIRPFGDMDSLRHL